MPTVMVVDDTAVIRETVAKLLRHEGYQTVCAANGKEALSFLQGSLPDVMLLDVMMPEMDGMQCLQAMRRDPRLQSLPVIIMSALSDDDDQRRARELGANEYLVKARISLAQMLERVKSYIPSQDN